MSNTGTSDWTKTDLPDFKRRKVFILNGAFYGSVVSMFARCNTLRADSIEEADFVVFTGGADVGPSLYGHAKDHSTYCSPGRDALEKKVFEECIALSKPMFGICRGAQFLHVMSGGTLWQDVNNHAGSHHAIVDIEEDIRVMASSIHHQMLQDNEKLQLVALTEEQTATTFRDQDLSIDLEAKGANTEYELEIEAGYYPDTHCFFVQGHPEVGPPEYTSWSMTKLKDFLEDWEKALNGGPDLRTLENKITTAKENS